MKEEIKTRLLWIVAVAFILGFSLGYYIAAAEASAMIRHAATEVR